MYSPESEVSQKKTNMLRETEPQCKRHSLRAKPARATILTTFSCFRRCSRDMCVADQLPVVMIRLRRYLIQYRNTPVHAPYAIRHSIDRFINQTRFGADCVNGVDRPLVITASESAGRAGDLELPGF